MTEKYQSREQRRKAMEDERNARKGSKKKVLKKDFSKRYSYPHLLLDLLAY